MEDREILDLYWKRNEQAIRETDRAYGTKLQGLACRIVENRQDSEECVSDTYMAAWDHIPPQKPNYFFAWLAKVCRNFAMGILDRRHAAKRSAEMVTLMIRIKSRFRFRAFFMRDSSLCVRLLICLAAGDSA